MTHSDFDVVVFGATSFVGRILCQYLTAQYGVGRALNWAAAGRSLSKLEALRESLGATAEDLELLVADAADEYALQRMCAPTRVVISTVGPYALYGEPLVRVCAQTGTDYCDLAGEVQWIRRMISAYGQAARESGACLVHCCGFDSIPSDLGVFFMQQHAVAHFGVPCVHVKMRVKAMRGGISGGTATSLLNLFKEAAANPAVRKQLADPYSLCPADHAFTSSQHHIRWAEYDNEFDAWAAPFVMAAVNTRIVHRSNALSDNAYGEAFRYSEALLTGRGVKGWGAAVAVAAGLNGLLLAAAFRPSRWTLEKFVLPAPGTGPSAKARARGYFDLRLTGETAAGQRLFAKVAGDTDPGYAATSKMLGQAGVCMALDCDKTDKPGGFWTPASLFGARLLKRLPAQAGVTFELLNRPNA